MLNLDTHILLHALAGSLRPKERALLEAEEWGIADIVLWEIATLARLGRIELDIGDRQFARCVSQIEVWPITLEICRAIQTLDFGGDPADQLIAATSVAHGVPLLTRDARIRRSRVVPLARG